MRTCCAACRRWAGASTREPHLVRSGRAARLEPAELGEMLRQVPSAFVHSDLGALAAHLLERDHVRDSQSAPLE